ARWTARNASPQTRYGLSVLTLAAMALAVPATIIYLMTPALTSTMVERSIAAAPGGSVVPFETAFDARTRITIEIVLPWLVLAWATGAALLLLRLLGGWITARRGVDRSIACERDFATLAARLGLTRPVDVLISPLALVPHVFGWVKPVVML